MSEQMPEDLESANEELPRPYEMVLEIIGGMQQSGTAEVAVDGGSMLPILVKLGAPSLRGAANLLENMVKEGLLEGFQNSNGPVFKRSARGIALTPDRPGGSLPGTAPLN